MEAHQDIYKYLSPFLVGLLISTGIGLIIGLVRRYTKLIGSTISVIRTFPIAFGSVTHWTPYVVLTQILR